jgi:hypothetical protein
MQFSQLHAPSYLHVIAQLHVIAPLHAIVQLHAITRLHACPAQPCLPAILVAEEVGPPHALQRPLRLLAGLEASHHRLGEAPNGGVGVGSRTDLDLAALGHSVLVSL